MTRSLSLSHPIHLVLGLIIWSCWFVAMYGGLSVACAVDPPEGGLRSITWINFSLLALTVMTALVLFNLSAHCWRACKAAPASSEQTRFVLQVAAGLYLSAMVITIAIGLPAAILPPCL